MSTYLFQPTGLTAGQRYRVDTGATNGTAATITRVDPQTAIDGSIVVAGDDGTTARFTASSATLYARPLNYLGTAGTAVTLTGTIYPIAAGDGGSQQADADLTAIAGLDATQSGVIASDGSGWLRKSYAALKTALTLAKADVGLGNVDNTSNATERAATATLTNKTIDGGSNTLTNIAQASVTGLATALADAGRTGRPGDSGFVAWNFDTTGAGNSSISSNGVIYLLKVPIPAAISVTKIYWCVTAVGVTPTASQNYVGLYDSTGARLASASADSDAATAGVRTTTISSTALSVGWVYVALLFNAGTAPTLSRASTGSNIPVNAGLTAATYRFAQNSTGQTTLPSTLTLASNTSGITYWCALGA